MVQPKIFSRLLIVSSLIVLASCGSPETQPETSASTGTSSTQGTVTSTTEAAAPVQDMSVSPLDVLKQYNRAMKQGDTSAARFATGKAATTKSYDYLKPSASGFSITYFDPQIVEDNATIEFKVVRETPAMYVASLTKIAGQWKIEKIQKK